MKKKLYYYKIIVVAAFVMIMAGCSVTDKYSMAYDFYMKSNYVVAIQLYDDFLENHSETALAVKSRLERSDCYYQLGYKAYKKQNWPLAARLFFLSNSKVSDELLDNCYYELSKISKQNQDIEKTLDYYDKITRYLKDSELIPEVLFHRINIYLDRNEKYQAFNDYHFLWANFPESEYTTRIQPNIDKLLPFYVEQAVDFKQSEEYNKALDLLFKLNQYPTSVKDRILDEISDIYLLKAEIATRNLKLQNAKGFYDSVLIYTPQKSSVVEQKTKQTCEYLIERGKAKITQQEFDEAIEIYQKCFLIRDDYKNAQDAVEEARDLKQNYNQAIDLRKQAREFEKEENFQQALNYYRRSYAKYKLDDVKNKIFIMNNLSEAEEDPKGFALDIMLDYKNGKLSDKILLLYEEQRALFGEELVSSSGWRVSYAAGEYNYEVRYDILTPDKNYYFAWRVDLKNRKLSPSNKISEDIMKN